MPIHDWTRVEAGIFQDFHHAWIEQIKRTLNRGVLPEDYYALAEQRAVGFGPDVLTLQSKDEPGGVGPDLAPRGDEGGGLMLSPPKARLAVETDMEFYRRKQSTVTVRHVSGDRVVAIVEIVSPGNKASAHAIRAFLDKAAELLERRLHLLILDLFPPGPRDPSGLHGALWELVAGQQYEAPSDKPLTLAAYESDWTLRAFIEPVAVGDSLPEMPLFLIPGGHVVVPLDNTYQDAFDAVPRRWRNVLEPS